MPGTLDRDAGELCEQGDRLLVVLGELCPVLLVGEIEVPVRLTVDEDRHPQERAHLGMAERERVRARMASDVGQSQRHRMGDEYAEHTAAPWQLADLAPSGLINALT